MKKMIAAALLSVLNSVGYTASYQQVTVALSALGSEACNELACTSVIKGTINFSAVVHLTPSEEAAFAEDATLEVQYQGLNVSFQLSEAGFQNGENSLKYFAELSDPGMTGSQTLTAKWSNGILELQGNRTVKSATSTRSHSSSTFSEVDEKELFLAGGQKSHAPNIYIVPITVGLSNSGGEVFQVRANVVVDVKESTKRLLEGLNQSNTRLKLKAKSTSFAPLAP